MGIRLPEGSDTPFSFGANVTPEAVNYNGNSPYAGGEKGLYRQKLNPTAHLAVLDDKRPRVETGAPGVSTVSTARISTTARRATG